MIRFIIVWQAQELRAYFKGLGAEISEEKSPKGIEDDLHKIIGVCDACFKEVPEAEIESILNGIVSMLVLVSFAVSWLWIMQYNYLEGCLYSALTNCVSYVRMVFIRINNLEIHP